VAVILADRSRVVPLAGRSAFESSQADTILTSELNDPLEPFSHSTTRANGIRHRARAGTNNPPPKRFHQMNFYRESHELNAVGRRAPRTIRSKGCLFNRFARAMVIKLQEAARKAGDVSTAPSSCENSFLV
jgi:hypothetical protein